ncbi:hypothetical protein F4824DRAFT_484963 [Ustulina deusta]|nr:hypothetical protein F4823DRAFT_244741 [Ustulina deusta]KAI3327419.1 hypothetical protein F4824DRAFT_484963 [Ustulina deusta]
MRSLQSAFPNLRLGLAPRMLSVDGICINQSDLSERGKQTVLMQQIYWNMSKTVVNLGDDNADSELAAKYLEYHMWCVRGAIADFMNQRRDAEDSGEMMQVVSNRWRPDKRGSSRASTKMPSRK